MSTKSLSTPGTAASNVAGTSGIGPGTARGAAAEPAPGTGMRDGLRRTPLYDDHVAAGAKMIEFAGFEMPAYYAGPAKPVYEEHMAVRTECGVFDVSHMGQIEVLGRGAEELLQRLLSNDIGRMAAAQVAEGEHVPPEISLDSGSPVEAERGAGARGPAARGPVSPQGRAQYNLICAPDGGVLDDLIAYRLAPERFLLVTNAANHAADVAWFRAHAEGFDAAVEDRATTYGMLAVQGPTARSLLGDLTEMELPARMRTRAGRIAGTPAIACGSGYTGEDGVELLCEPRAVTGLWRALLDAGARPAGLAARDTLRLEACLPLYGNELSAARSPIEAGLGWCCREETGFVGADAVLAARERGPSERLVAFRLAGPGIARQGNAVSGGGEVTSGTHSPCLGMGIGLAYVPSDRSAPGTELEIDVRGRTRPAVVCEMPFVTKRARQEPEGRSDRASD